MVFKPVGADTTTSLFPPRVMTALKGLFAQKSIGASDLGAEPAGLSDDTQNGLASKYVGFPKTVKNALTGWFHFDGFGPDQTGSTDCTTLLQTAVNAVIASGGGTLYVPSGTYRVNGTVYINKPDEMTPFRLIGEFVDYSDAYTAPRGTTFSKQTAGDLFRLNLDSSVNPGGGNWYTYSFTNVFENFSIRGSSTGSTVVYGLRAYRSRIVMRHIHTYYLDALVYQDPISPTSYANWENYCDQSTYEDIRMMYPKTYGLFLNGSDSTTISRISAYNPQATAVSFIHVQDTGGLIINAPLLADPAGVITGGTAAFNFLRVTGLSINGVHLERNNYPAAFQLQACWGVKIDGLHERFRGKTLFKLIHSGGVMLDGINVWSTRDSGSYDVDASSTPYSSDVSIRGSWITDYNSLDTATTRALSINDPGGTVAYVRSGRSRNTQNVSSYTLAYSDLGKTLDISSSNGTTVTIPPNSAVPFPVGTVIEIVQYSTGSVLIASGAGVTLDFSGSSPSTTGQFSTLTISKRAIDEWILSGSTPSNPQSALSVGQETIDRRIVGASSSTLTLTGTGNLRLVYFTARKTEVITQVRLWSGTTAASATPTLVRFGLWTVAADGSLTARVASTPSDTTLFAAVTTPYTKALGASYTIQAGQRYAFGVLVVTAGTAPTIIGLVSTMPALELAAGPRDSGFVAGQADLPSTVAAASITNSGHMPYAALLP